MESGPAVPLAQFVQILRPELAGGQVRNMGFAPLTQAQMLSPPPLPQPTPAQTEGWNQTMHMAFLVLNQGLFFLLYGLERGMKRFHKLTSEDPYYHVSPEKLMSLSFIQFLHL